MSDIHWSRSVHHDGSLCYVVANETISFGSTAKLRVRTGLDAPVGGMFVRTNPDGEQHMAPLRLIAKDAATCWWEGDIQIRMVRNNYRFLLLTDEGHWWLTAAGMMRYTPTDATDFRILAHYHAPSWVRDSVYYQIFPDRFVDVDPANNVRDGEYECYNKPVVVRPWGEILRSLHETGAIEFFGGDLWGIIKHLDYLQDLGINALYLTPIFTSPSNHKYDMVESNPTLSNYVYAFTQEPVLNWMLNTTFACALSTLIGILFSMTGAYALSRFRFRGREASLSLLLALQAFPGLLAITTYYYLLQYLNLLNTAPLVCLALIYASGSLVFGTWNIKGYFDTLPVELEQAAMIDGATMEQAFWRVTLPLAAPALAASALFMFVGSYTEFALANFVLNANSTGSSLTFILGLNALQGTYTTPWGYFAATSVIISVPLMLLFLYARKFFQSGLTVGGVKG